MPKEFKQEISYVLDEIENINDRNTIYISIWLAKRLAVECHSKKANEFKYFDGMYQNSISDKQFASKRECKEWIKNNIEE